MTKLTISGSSPMRYLGGKSRLAKYIAPVILERSKKITQYCEPFLGSAAVAERLAALGVPPYVMQLSDNSYDLMLLYRGIQDGWIPPSHVSEQEYNEQRNARPSTFRGFVGYGCSWGGKLFGGYARGESRNYAAESGRALLKTVGTLRQAAFIHLDYRDLRPVAGTVVYCDPPYENTTKYSADFDHDEFWETMREWSRRCNVFVSEYSAPDDFVSIWAKEHHTSVRGNRGSEQRIERVFIHESRA